MKYITLILSALTTFLFPIKGLLLLMIFFIAADTYFGIYAAIKLNGIQAFKSTKLFNVVVKSFFYLFTIIMTFMIDKYVFEGSLFDVKFLLAKSITMVWIYIEIKSLDETSMKLGNKSFWVLIKEMINKSKEIKKDLNELIDKEEPEVKPEEIKE
jgi:hypothetical protein